VTVSCQAVTDAHKRCRNQARTTVLVSDREGTVREVSVCMMHSNRAIRTAFYFPYRTSEAFVEGIVTREILERMGISEEEACDE